MLELHRLREDMTASASPVRREAAALAGEIAGFLRAPSPRTAGLLAGWREDFQAIYGDVRLTLSGNGRLDAAALLEAYGIAVPEAERGGQLMLLLFAIQTYFSLLVKVITRSALGLGTGGDPAGLILGTFARARGIVNYCTPDWFCWPVFELENGFGRILTAIEAQAAAYASPSAAPAGRDDIKQIYESLIPAQLRHALGEYYTPDWLAEFTLERGLDFCRRRGVENPRIVDPTCGSGTFLLQAIARKRAEGRGLAEILASVQGLDVNPLAVLTAKTNYLLAVLPLLGEEPVELPIWQADVLALANAEAEEEIPLPDFSAASRPEEAVRRAQRAELSRARRMDRADLAAGNPPWINWEYLPPAIRARSQHLWRDYGLVSAKGPRLSFLKEDISVLITYTVLDKLLAEGGVLAFVIRQAMFKSARNGASFRRFRLGETGVEALRVEDFSALKIFPGAAASAAVLFARKGAETAYPVPYAVWRKRKRGKHLNPYAPLAEVLERTAAEELQARPAGEDPASAWLTAPGTELPDLGRVLGRNPYRARTGVFTGGANAVYWLDIRAAEHGLVSVENQVRRAKRKTEPVAAELEDAYLYPMLKGGGIRRWRVRYDTWLLCPHTAQTKLRPVAWEQLAAECPRTAAYLEGFRETLDSRGGFAGWERAIQREQFHAVLRVGAYTFAPWKVVWKYIASEFVCAVIGTVEDPFLGEKLLLPNEKVMYVGLENREEAYYLCGVLSSTPVARCVKGYMNPTSISAHVLEKLRIPAYDPDSPLHREIARLCREGHEAGGAEPYLRDLDALVERLYGESA